MLFYVIFLFELASAWLGNEALAGMALVGCTKEITYYDDGKITVNYNYYFCLL